MNKFFHSLTGTIFVSIVFFSVSVFVRAQNTPKVTIKAGETASATLDLAKK